MVSVSVAPLLVSAIVTPENGWTAASEVWCYAATVPVMVGAAAGSVSITVVVVLTVGVAQALLKSLSVKLVVELVPGAPAVGVKASASSSLVMVAGARRQGVDAAVAADEAGAAQRSVASAAERDGQRVGGAAVAVGDRHGGERRTAASARGAMRPRWCR